MYREGLRSLMHVNQLVNTLRPLGFLVFIQTFQAISFLLHHDKQSLLVKVTQ